MAWGPDFAYKPDLACEPEFANTWSSFINFMLRIAIILHIAAQ